MMATSSESHITVEACQYIIEKLENYANCLTESNTKMQQTLDNLSETHRDQNFADFDDKFTPLWNDILVFKDAVDNFREYMIGLKEKIKDYEAIIGSYNP